MKILLLTGSPHKKGTTAALASAFDRGAAEAGHQLTRFDTAFMKIAPCLGCDHCRKNGGRCVHGDGMEEILPVLLEADLVVLVTPLYYFGMSAQLKAVIDRFYAVNTALRQSPKKALLLAASGDDEPGVMEALVLHYQAVLGYLHWEDCGMLLARGMYTPEDLAGTPYLLQAEEMGRRPLGDR
ncbi:flavodoxin family protein [Bittarella massiliensis (ex Durand et al. 2017)]|uniref:flavodoxin family protein n=1 Tax=Bittarella massiliensis (ex Durand et al. 2017) TaxID=1720313 RepID=UPI001AA15F57|nr:flavodoxin family protein [Bittarella massiliensis (ex Durand et al. 2017)]